jgi:23S rRNA (uracil1939-C5)-methyltransferase
MWRVEGGRSTRLTDSPERRKPICRHFGHCGGCTTQHLSEPLEGRWKHDLIADAFRHHGIEADIAPVRRVGLQSRRRALLGVERRGDHVVVGYREEGRHKLVDLEECPLLDPVIVAAIGPLKEMARLAMPDRQGGRLVVTHLDQGLDVSFDNATEGLTAPVRERLAVLARDARLARLMLAGEPIALGTTRPTVTIGGVAVAAEPGIFLQAVPEAEAMLIYLVDGAVPCGAKRVADLFCGLGTFTLPLARRAAVTAIDADKRAIKALADAARRASALKPVETRSRDLFREPLSAKELEPFDAIVFDPPRAGAAAQTERLARSKVPVVVAVSCNPATLARDAKTLIDGGMRMGPVTPIDQFLFSPHLEAVVTFERS